MCHLIEHKLYLVSDQDWDNSITAICSVDMTCCRLKLEEAHSSCASKSMIVGNYYHAKIELDRFMKWSADF